MSGFPRWIRQHRGCDPRSEGRWNRLAAEVCTVEARQGQRLSGSPSPEDSANGRDGLDAVRARQTMPLGWQRSLPVATLPCRLWRALTGREGKA